MNQKQFIALLVAVAVICGAAWWYSYRRAGNWSNQSPELGQKLLGNFQVNDVAQIHIQQGANNLTLLNTNGLWRIAQRDDYPASFQQISELLLKLRDLKIVQSEQVEPSQMGQLRLAPPGSGTNSATLLALCGVDGKPIRTLWLGKRHVRQESQASSNPMDEGYPDGRYVLAATNSTTVAVISDPINEAEPEPDLWLDKTFLTVKNPQTVSVDYPAATNSWTLARQSKTNQWELADAGPDEKLNPSQASETANSFSSPSFEDVATETNLEQMGLEKPTRIEIKTFDGFDYSLKVGYKTNDNYYVTVHTSADFPKEPAPSKNEKPAQRTAQDKTFQAHLKSLKEQLAQESALNRWVYLVPSWSLNPLLKARSQLLLPKPAVTETNTPADSSSEIRTKS